MYMGFWGDQYSIHGVVGHIYICILSWLNGPDRTRRQDRTVQTLMDELDLPPDRANLFEVGRPVVRRSKACHVASPV